MKTYIRYNNHNLEKVRDIDCQETFPVKITNDILSCSFYALVKNSLKCGGTCRVF